MNESLVELKQDKILNPGAFGLAGFFRLKGSSTNTGFPPQFGSRFLVRRVIGGAALISLLFILGCDAPHQLMGNSHQDSFVSMVENSSHVPASSNLSDDRVLELVKWSTDLLLADSRTRHAFADGTGETIPRYFREYLLDDSSTRTSSFCQRSTLSAIDVLAAYGISTIRYDYEQNGVGIHTFFSYRTSQGLYAVVDPYYCMAYRFNGHPVEAKDLKNRTVRVSDCIDQFIDIVWPLGVSGPDRNPYHSEHGLQSMWDDGEHII